MDRSGQGVPGRSSSGLRHLSVPTTQISFHRRRSRLARLSRALTTAGHYSGRVWGGSA